MQENKKELTLEENFTRIEEIISRMEDGSATLDESFELYKEGLRSIQAANASLDQMEKAMLILNSSGETEVF